MTDESGKETVEALVRIANRYGFLLVQRISDTHRILKHDSTGKLLSIELV